MATEIGLRVGRRIRQGRLEKGLNQPQLAAKIGPPVDTQRISDWERGVNQPSPRYMDLLAAALERDVGWFYAEEEAETADLMGALGNAKHSQLDRIEKKLDLLLVHSVPADALSDFERQLEEIVRPPPPRDERDVENGDARDASG